MSIWLKKRLAIWMGVSLLGGALIYKWLMSFHPLRYAT
jgi:hypothetical protein